MPKSESQENRERSFSSAILAELQIYESRNVVQIDLDGSWPIVWDRAKGMKVWDADGREYLDATAAFGVVAAGHANNRIVSAGRKQMGRLLYAMGDVHPHAGKGRLARRLSELTFGEPDPDGRPAGNGRGKTIFCNSGFEAVEAALKTVCLATGKPDVLAFKGAYHGLGYGSLNATHRDHFKSPFRSQLKGFAHFVPFPRTESEAGDSLERIRELSRRHPIGGVLFEPIQGRAGIRVPADSFHGGLRKLTTELGILLVADEIYTGFGRTGAWFACQREGIRPDIYCLGKALTGGFPMSACVGRAELMDAAWPQSSGEAIHTSTFLGHPVGCAMALAQIEEIAKRKLIKRALEYGRVAQAEFRKLSDVSPWIRDVRGRGLMIGIELRDEAPGSIPIGVRVMKGLLAEGWIALPEGERSEVIAFTPPLIIGKKEIGAFSHSLRRVLDSIR